MLDLAKHVVELFVSRTITLSVCESITGGSLAAAITDVPGASAIFRGGLITYASDLKTALAGVDADVIRTSGVVNEYTARTMAFGARQACATDWAISTTGVAGPEPLDGAEVGTVWFGIVGTNLGATPNPVYTECAHFDGDRDAIRKAAVQHALEMAVRVM